MEIEKEFVVRKSGASARAVLDDDETLCSLFPDTEIVSSEDGVRETLTHYAGFGAARDLRFIFRRVAEGMDFEKVCDGNVWRSLTGAIRLRELNPNTTHGSLRMEGRTRTLVPEAAIRGPMREQIDPMTQALRSRMEASEA